MPLSLTILFSFCAILSVILGIFVLSRKNRSAADITFALFSISTAIWLTLLYLGFATAYNHALSLLLIRLTFGFSLLVPLTLSLFFYYFPKPIFKISIYIKIAFISLTGFLFISSIFTPWIETDVVIENNILISDIFGPLYMVYLLYFIFHFILSIILAIKQIIHTRGITRKKVLIAAIGSFAFVSSAIMTNVILPIFNIFILQLESITFTLLFIIPAFYAIQRYRSFHLSLNVLKLLRIISIITILIAIIFISTEFLNLIPNTPQFIPITIASIIGVISYRKLEFFIPEFITESQREFQKAIQILLSKIYKCSTYTELMNLLEEIFMIRLNIQNIHLFLIRDQNTDVTTDIDIYYKNIFTKLLEKEKPTFISIHNLDNNDKKDLIYIKQMKKIDAVICIPLFSENNLIGLFSLGNPNKEHHYSIHQINEITNIKKDLEIIFMNILLTKNLKVENDLMRKIVEKKTKDLSQQNEEILKLLRQQEDFIAVTAHEFRTPLSIALFQLEDTIDSHKFSPQLLSEIQTVQESLDNLKHLTQKLFDIKQFDLKKVELHKENTNIHTFISTIYKQFQSLMKEKNIQFSLKNKLNKNEILNIDPSWMREVIYNVLNNAYKFTPPEKIVDILLYKEKDHVIIKVGNTGKRIPDDDKQRIFEKFQTINVTMGKGIGLGLYICKKIVELHNGKIWVEDYLDDGTAFYIELS